MTRSFLFTINIIAAGVIEFLLLPLWFLNFNGAHTDDYVMGHILSIPLLLIAFASLRMKRVFVVMNTLVFFLGLGIVFMVFPNAYIERDVIRIIVAALISAIVAAFNILFARDYASELWREARICVSNIVKSRVKMALIVIALSLLMIVSVVYNILQDNEKQASVAHLPEYYQGIALEYCGSPKNESQFNCCLGYVELMKRDNARKVSSLSGCRTDEVPNDATCVENLYWCYSRK